jgi:hypothetical protein
MKTFSSTPFLLLFVLLGKSESTKTIRGSSNYDNLGLQNDFPSIDDTVEMAALSVIVYTFRDVLDDTGVCQMVNDRNFNTTGLHVPEVIQENTDIQCHWYLHDRIQGTQVMLVSSPSKKYNALVFAGTDNMRSALTDADIMTVPFGDGESTVLSPDLAIRVHAGFNHGVFLQNIFAQVLDQFNALQSKYPSHRLFTTGHSLGAAESILAAVALTMKQQEHKSRYRWWPWKRKTTVQAITNINFGCPRIGNENWRAFVDDDSSVESLAIWRLVLGWDLVPRLPELFKHVGHTIELLKNSLADESGSNATAVAYYQHYGDESLGLAGVPFGWSAKPYIWVPGALWSHHVTKYWSVLYDWANSTVEHRATWVSDFEKVDSSHNNSDDGRPRNVDDDFWVNPPDDDFQYRDDLLESRLERMILDEPNRVVA